MKRIIQIGLLVLCVGLMPKIAQAEVNNNTNYLSTSETVKATVLTPEQEFEQLKPFLESKDTKGKTNAEKIGLIEGTTGTKLSDYNSVTVDENGHAVGIYWRNRDLIGDLNVSNFTKLTVLYCFYNQLTSLDVSNLTALNELNCWGNQLTSLDVTNLTALTNLYCWNNQLTNLDVTNLTALTELYCWNNQLRSLDVSKLTALTELNCNWNQLTSLDVGNLTALTNLNCLDNNLTSLDVSKLTALTELNCSVNKLTSLDVSKLTNLIDLRCGSTQLTSLDVSNLTALTSLFCSFTQLKNLDVTKLSNLINLSCNENLLTMKEIKKIKASVPINLNLFYYSPQYILGERVDDSKYYLAPKGDIKDFGTDSSTYKWSDGTTGSNYDFSDKIGDTISCTITDGDIILKTNNAIIVSPIWEQMELEEAITKSKQILANENSTAEQIIDAMKDLADAIKNYEGDKNISK